MPELVGRLPYKSPQEGHDVAHRPRRLLVVAPLLLALAGCGSDGDPDAVAPESGLTPTASTTTLPTPGASGAAGSPGTPGSTSGSVAPGASGSPGATRSPGSGTGRTNAPESLGPNKFLVTLTLDHKCVEKGGEQVARIKTEPNARVIIDTLYSDKKDGQTHGGIELNGKTDAKGEWVFRWRVALTAPLGTAYTRAAAGKDGRNGRDIDYFEVKAVC